MAEDIILSGEGLLRAKIAKSQSKVLPTRGQKFNIANGSWLETTQIETLLDERQEWIAEEKTEKRSQLSEANWLQDVRVAEVTKKVGSCWQSFGVQKDHIYLQPEEALFLVETTCLELLFGGVPVSVQQGYSLLLQNQEELENYRVYRELMQVGYRARRSKEISFDQNGAPCEKSCVDGTESAGQSNKIGPASTDLSNSKSSAEVDGVTKMPEMTEGQSGKENGCVEQKNKEEVTLSEPVVETPNSKRSAEVNVATKISGTIEAQGGKENGIVEQKSREEVTLSEPELVEIPYSKRSAEVNLATMSEAVEGQGERENGSVEQKSREEVTLSEPGLVEIPITKSSAEVNEATEMAKMKEGEDGKGSAELKNKEVTLSESELTVEASVGHSDQPVVDSNENSTANGVAICEDIVPLGLVNETSVDETEGVSVKKARPSSPTLLVEVTGQDSKRPKMDTPLKGEAFVDADSSSSGIKRTVEERNQENSEDEPILKKNRASNLFPSAMQVFACTEEDDIIVLEEEATDYPASPEPIVAGGDNPALPELTNTVSDNTVLPQLTNKMPNNNEPSDSITESNKAVLVQEEGMVTASSGTINSSIVSAPMEEIIKLGSLSNDTTLLEDAKKMCIGEDLSVTKVTSVEENVSVTMVTPVGAELSITKDTSVKADLSNTPKLTRTIGQDVKVHSQILSSRDEPSSSGLAKAVKSGHNKTTSIPSDDDDIIVLSDSDDDESYSRLKNVSVSFKPRNHSIFPNVTITRVHRPTEESKESDHEVYDLDEVLEDTARSPEPENQIIQKLAINYTTVKPTVVRPILTNVKATVTAIKPVSLPVQKSHELDILFVDKVVRESPGSPTNQLELESNYAPKMIPGKFPFLNRKDIAWKMGNRSGIGLESALKVCATPSTPPFIQFGSAIKDWDTGDDDIIILSDDDDEESDDESDVIVLSDDGDDESSNKAIVPTTPPSPVVATQVPKVEPTVVVPKPANKRPYRKHNSDNENDETDSVNEATLKLEDGGVKPAELPSGKPETPRGLFVPTGIVPFVWDSSVLWGNVPDTLREVADELKRMKKRTKMMPNSPKKIEMIDKFETLLYPFSEQVYKKYVQKRNDKLAAQSRKGRPKFAKVRKPVITEQLSSGSGGSSGSESDAESNFPETLEEIIDITAGDDERDRLLAMVPSMAGLKKVIIPIPSAQFLPRNVDPPFPFYTWENGKCAPSILVDRVSESNPAVKKSPAPSRCSSVSSSPALSQCTTVVPYIPPPAMPERSVQEERNEGLPGYAVYSSSFSSRRFGVNPWTDNKWGAFQLHVFGRGTPFGFQNFGPNHCPTPSQFQRHRVPSYNPQRNYGYRGRGQQHRERGQRYVRENLRNSTEGQQTVSLNEPSSVKDNPVATPGTNQDSEPVVKTERLGPEEMSALPKVKGVTNIVSWKDFKERVVVPSLRVKQEVETTNQAASVGSILDRLSVIKNVGKPTLGGTCTNPVKPTFDLFAPDVRYRKSGSDPPNFRLAISRGLSVPSGEELQPLLSHCEGTTRAVVAVPLSSVLYFEFAQFEIPHVSDYKS